MKFLCAKPRSTHRFSTGARPVLNCTHKRLEGRAGSCLRRGVRPLPCQRFLQSRSGEVQQGVQHGCRAVLPPPRFQQRQLDLRRGRGAEGSAGTRRTGDAEEAANRPAAQCALTCGSAVQAASSRSRGSTMTSAPPEPATNLARLSPACAGVSGPGSPTCGPEDDEGTWGCVCMAKPGCRRSWARGGSPCKTSRAPRLAEPHPARRSRLPRRPQHGAPPASRRRPAPAATPALPTPSAAPPRRTRPRPGPQARPPLVPHRPCGRGRLPAAMRRPCGRGGPLVATLRAYPAVRVGSRLAHQAPSPSPRRQGSGPERPRPGVPQRPRAPSRRGRGRATGTPRWTG